MVPDCGCGDVHDTGERFIEEVGQDSAILLGAVTHLETRLEPSEHGNGNDDDRRTRDMAGHLNVIGVEKLARNIGERGSMRHCSC